MDRVVGNLTRKIQEPHFFHRDRTWISAEAGKNQGGAVLRAVFYLGREYLPPRVDK